MMTCCCTYPALCLDESGNTQLMMGNSNCMVVWWPMATKWLIQWLPRSSRRPGVLQKESNYPRRMTELCFKILRVCTACSPPMGSCRRLQTASLCTTDTAGAIGYTGSSDPCCIATWIAAPIFCKAFFSSGSHSVQAVSGHSVNEPE